jgi:hypothetical protein
MNAGSNAAIPQDVEFVLLSPMRLSLRTRVEHVATEPTLSCCAANLLPPNRGKPCSHHLPMRWLV